MKVKIEVADITKQRVDAIVNAANEACLGGGGVDGAIHTAAGPALVEECLKLPEERPGVRCSTGKAVITDAGNLPCKKVIHTVGPDCREVVDECEQDRLLASAYLSSLELAKKNGLLSVAFPSISTGIFGFPIGRAAKIVAKTVADFLAHEPDMSVTMCIYDGNPKTQAKLLKAYTDAFTEQTSVATVPAPSANAGQSATTAPKVQKLSAENFDFLEKVSRDLTFIVQRINRQISEGREPKPGVVAYEAFQNIDLYMLRLMTKIDTSGQAERLNNIYDEVRRSESKGWSQMVLPNSWKPELYDPKNPAASTGLAEWGFDRAKVVTHPEPVSKAAAGGFPEILTAEMLANFKRTDNGATHPHHGWIDGVHYIAKCKKYMKENPSVTPSDDHVHKEYLADCFLREAGLNVPESREYRVDFHNGDGPQVVRLAKFIENTTPLYDAFQKSSCKGAFTDRILLAYPVLSFVSAIDTFNNDNALVDAEGNIWYVDNGADFDYRAKGGRKGWWFDRSDVDDPNTGYLALRNFPGAVQLQTMLGVPDETLWSVAARYDFVALAKKLPKELVCDSVMRYAEKLNCRARMIFEK